MQFFAIQIKQDGSWEKDWEPLHISDEQSTVDLISRISWLTYQELLHGFTKPFLQEVGLGPEACIIKLDANIKPCYYRGSCPSHDPKLCDATRDYPLCYEASVANPEVRPLITRLIDLWKMGFYVILVEPEPYV